MKLSEIQDFPILQTDRLILRKVELADDDAIFSMRSDVRNNLFINRDLPKTIRDAQIFIKNINEGFHYRRWLYWGVSTIELPIIVGTICLWHFAENPKRAEIGYEIHPNFQGYGYMTEAIKIVLKYGFETLKLDKIDAFTHRENLSSISVLKKNDFQFLKKVEENNRDKNFLIFEKKPDF